MTTRPLIGLMPSWRYNELRLVAVSNAIARYRKEGMKIPSDWLSEQTDLVALLNRITPFPDREFYHHLLNLEDPIEVNLGRRVYIHQTKQNLATHMLRTRKFWYTIVGDNGETLVHSQSFTQKHNAIEALAEYFPDWPVVDTTIKRPKP